MIRHEVSIRRDPFTGDVILSRRPPYWDSFLAALVDTTVPAKFLDERECHQAR